MFRGCVGLIGLAILLVMPACRRDESEPPVTIDLLQQFPYTVSGQHAPRIELGRAGSEAYLLDGWSAREVLSSGVAVVRGVQRRAAMQFALAEPLDRRLIVRCARIAAHASPPQKVMVRLNQHWLVPIVPQDGFTTFEVLLPAMVQRRGRNVLELSHRGLPRRGPADSRTHDTVAYEWIAIERADGRNDAPFVVWDAARAAALMMPAPAAIDYFVRVPVGAELLAGVANPSPTARVAIAVQREGAREQVLWDRPSASAVHVDLSAYAGAVVKLSLRAQGSGTLQVAAPRIIARRVDAPARPARAAGAAPPVNVILYVVDTLRADHLGCYGYPRPTSPHIDAFARDATLFTRVVGQASWTRPATASILTGLEPHRHGALRLTDHIRADATTLAEVLHAHGYDTAAFVTNVNVSAPFGFGRGFGAFTYLPEEETRPSLHVLSEALNSAAVAWLEAPHASPFFLYLHATDPHAPYTPAPAVARRFYEGTDLPQLAAVSEPLRRLVEDPNLATAENIAYLTALYDGEISTLDANFGAFVTQLQRLGLYDKTLIVLAADHGEEFHEHGGFEHGRTLYEEQLRVPLIMRMTPAFARGARVATLARQIDIMPTILDVAGVPIPDSVQGATLANRSSAQEAFAQTSLSGNEVAALVTDRWKVIRRNGFNRQSFEIYNLDTDGLEEHSLVDSEPVLLGYAQQRIEQWAAGGPPRSVQETKLDSATAERLRMLGYTQ
jgi:arylsulfatase A-like enzyme